MSQAIQPYALKSIRRNESVEDLGRENSALYHVFGIDVAKRGNLYLIEEDVIVYTIGNTAVFQNINSKSRQFLRGPEDEGVGCIAIHPSKKMFALGCCGFQPKVLIYSYPEMEIIKTLSGGAERGFSCMAFNVSGAKLATIATFPDYMLTLWDWEEEKVALHAKAFGQDVYSIKFSLDNDLKLASCGTGHIRFWKMASTFTGLKLQGNIGKFGKVELSDVLSFVELPDGKVVSGSESGAVLLWEGNFVKCRFVLATGASCHAGEITSVEFDRKERCIITAGIDGFIKIWEFDIMDQAEVDSDITMDFQIMPIAEFSIGKGRGVKTLVDSGSFDGKRIMVIQDTSGSINSYTFTLESNSLIEAFQHIQELTLQGKSTSNLLRSISVSSGHSAAVRGMDTSPVEHIAATAGADGQIIVWDYVMRKQLGSKRLDHGCNSLRWLPLSLDGSGMSFAVGCTDGVVRVFTIVPRNNDLINIVLTMSTKPHNLPIVDISFSQSGSFLASSSTDGTVFIQNCKLINPDSNSWSPVGYVSIKNYAKGAGIKGTVQCDKIAWNTISDNTIICSCSDGKAREVMISELTNPLEPVENMESFEYNVPIRDVQIKKVENVVDGETTKEVTTLFDAKEAVYLMNRITSGIAATANIPTMSNGIAGIRNTLFEASTQEREYETGKEIICGFHSFDGKDGLKPPNVNCMRYSWSNRFFIIGSADGSVCLRPVNYFETLARFTSHNFYCGGVSAVASSFDDRYFLSSGKDGVLSVYRVAIDKILSANTKKLWQDLDAGVYSNQKVKAASKDDEPPYLHISVSQDDFSEYQIDAFPKDIDNVIAAPSDDGTFGKHSSAEFTDILPGAYSFEDDKLKSGEDTKKSAADVLKDRVKAQIRGLRKEFVEIQKSNKKLPESIKFSNSQMMVDGDFWDTIHQLSLEDKEEIDRECEMEAERAAVLRERVSKFFTDGLLVEEITVTSFSDYNASMELAVVQSLRTRGLDASLQEVLLSVRNLVKGEQLRDVQHRANTIAQKKALAAIDDMKDRHLKKESDKKAGEGKDSEADDKKSHHGSAVRREARKKRHEELAKHKVLKPNDNEDDPRDIATIKDAERTLGNFKMKSSDDYHISEEQRVNAVKKKQQMAMLEETMASMRLQFNEKLLILRDLKMKIVNNIRDCNTRIRSIDKELGATERSKSLWQPSVKSSEFPDDRDEVTMGELTKFQDIRAKKSWEKAEVPTHTVFTGKKTIIDKNPISNAYNTEQRPVDYRSDIKISEEVSSQPADNSPSNATLAKKAYYEVNDSVFKDWVNSSTSPAECKRLQDLEHCIPGLRAVKMIKEKRLTISNPADFVGSICSERRLQLESERSKLCLKIEKSVIAFNEAVLELRVQRHALLADLKLAEIRLMCLYREYCLLLTFESRDTSLQARTQRCANEKTEITAVISDTKSKLDMKLDELKSWQEKMNTLTTDLANMLPESNVFSEILNKIYKKKIKRSKNRGGEAGEEGEDEEDDDDDGGDDDDDEDEVEDACPSGCEPILYEKVLDFREKRLDVEEASVEIQKAIDDFKKSSERAKQREKAITKEGVQLEYEIQQFQLQKQAAMNQIDTLVPVKVSQIYCFNGNGLFTTPSDRPRPIDSTEDPDLLRMAANIRSPSSRELGEHIDMSNYVLFNNSELKRLDKRVHELHSECEESSVSFKELHGTRLQLKKQKSTLQSEIDILQKKVNDLQMLKFGRVLDLDDLEAGADRSKEEEAEALIREVEAVARNEQSSLQAEIEQLKKASMVITTQNTNLLSTVAELTEKKMQLSKDLNSDQAAPGQDVGGETMKEKEERERITTYIKLQAREIDSLRAEIAMLKRKDAPPIAIPSLPTGYQSGEGFLPPIPNNNR